MAGTESGEAFIRLTQWRSTGGQAWPVKRIVFDRAQLMQLAEALAAELEVSFGDDPHSPMATA